MAAIPRNAYEMTVGTRVFALSLPKVYDDILTEVGLADVQGQAGSPNSTDFTVGGLIENGYAFHLSLGLEGGKRGSCLIAADKFAEKSALIGKNYNGKVIKTVKIKGHTKIR